jgi:hypothetical protein
LSPLEQLGALQSSFSIPRTSIRAVHVASNSLREVRGMRLPGTGLPGVIALGHFRSRTAGHTFAAAYRGRPGLVLDLADDRFDRVVLGLHDAARIANDLPEVSAPAGSSPVRR